MECALPYQIADLCGKLSAPEGRKCTGAISICGAAGDLTAKGQYCAVFALTHPGQGRSYTCDPNFNVSQLGLITRWTPIKDVAFSAEVMWFHLDQKYAGTSTFGAGAPKPTAVYEFKDQDTVSFNVRVQRNF